LINLKREGARGGALRKRRTSPNEAGVHKMGGTALTISVKWLGDFPGKGDATRGTVAGKVTSRGKGSRTMGKDRFPGSIKHRTAHETRRNSPAHSEFHLTTQKRVLKRKSHRRGGEDGMKKGRKKMPSDQKFAMLFHHAQGDRPRSVCPNLKRNHKDDRGMSGLGSEENRGRDGRTP